jgi:hypothetical protein
MEKYQRPMFFHIENGLELEWPDKKEKGIRARLIYFEQEKVLWEISTFCYTPKRIRPCPKDKIFFIKGVFIFHKHNYLYLYPFLTDKLDDQKIHHLDILV